MDPSRHPIDPLFNSSQVSSNNPNEDTQFPQPPFNPFPFPLINQSHMYPYTQGMGNMSGFSNNMYPYFPPNYPSVPMFGNVCQSSSIHPTGSSKIQMTNKPVPEYPGYSTQEIPTHEHPSRSRWSSIDDILLCSAWLNISKDGVIGNEQSSNSFWKRIVAYYDQNRNAHTQVKRNKQGLMNRWGRLNHAVSKFVGYYDQILQRRESGLNETDKKNRALTLYKELEKDNFNYLHAWEVLRNEEKWRTQEGKVKEIDPLGDRGSKRSKNDSSGKYTSSSSNTCSQADEDQEVEFFIPRPPGRNASKGKGKRKITTSESSDSINNAMERQLEMEKEKLNLMKQYMKRKEEEDKFNRLFQLMQMDE